VALLSGCGKKNVEAEATASAQSSAVFGGTAAATTSDTSDSSASMGEETGAPQDNTETEVNDLAEPAISEEDMIEGDTVIPIAIKTGYGYLDSLESFLKLDSPDDISYYAMSGLIGNTSDEMLGLLGLSESDFDTYQYQIWNESGEPWGDIVKNENGEIVFTVQEDRTLGDDVDQGIKSITIKDGKIDSMLIRKRFNSVSECKEWVTKTCNSLLDATGRTGYSYLEGDVLTVKGISNDVLITISTKADYMLAQINIEKANGMTYEDLGEEYTLATLGNAPENYFEQPE